MQFYKDLEKTLNDLQLNGKNKFQTNLDNLYEKFNLVDFWFQKNLIKKFFIWKVLTNIIRNIWYNTQMILAKKVAIRFWWKKNINNFEFLKELWNEFLKLFKKIWVNIDFVKDEEVYMYYLYQILVFLYPMILKLWFKFTVIEWINIRKHINNWALNWNKEKTEKIEKEIIKEINSIWWLENEYKKFFSWLWFSEKIIKSFIKYNWYDVPIVDIDISKQDIFKKWNSEVSYFWYDIWWFEKIIDIMQVDVWLWKTFIWLFSNFLYLLYTKNIISIINEKLTYSKEDNLLMKFIDILNKKTVIISNETILLQYKMLLEKNWFKITEEWEAIEIIDWKEIKRKYYVFNNLIYLSENSIETTSKILFKNIIKEVSLAEIILLKYKNDSDYSAWILNNLTTKDQKEWIQDKFIKKLSKNWDNFLINILYKKEPFKIWLLASFINVLYINLKEYYKNILFNNDKAVLNLIKESENYDDWDWNNEWVLLELDSIFADISLGWEENNKKEEKKEINESDYSEYLKWLNKNEKEEFLWFIKDEEINIFVSSTEYFFSNSELFEAIENEDENFNKTNKENFFFGKNVIIDEIVFLDFWEDQTTMTFKLHNRSILILTAQNAVKNIWFITQLLKYWIRIAILNTTYFINSYWILKKDIKDEIKWYTNYWNLSYEVVNSNLSDLKTIIDTISSEFLKVNKTQFKNLFNSINMLFWLSLWNIDWYAKEINKKFNKIFSDLKNEYKIVWLFNPVIEYNNEYKEIKYKFGSINSSDDLSENEKLNLIISVYKDLFSISKKYNNKFYKEILNVWIWEVKNFENFLVRYKIDWKEISLIQYINDNITDEKIKLFISKDFKNKFDSLNFDKKFEVSKDIFKVDIKKIIKLLSLKNNDFIKVITNWKEFAEENFVLKQKNILVFFILFSTFLEWYESFLYWVNSIFMLQSKIEKLLYNTNEYTLEYKNNLFLNNSAEIKHELLRIYNNVKNLTEYYKSTWKTKIVNELNKYANKINKIADEIKIIESNTKIWVWQKIKIFSDILLKIYNDIIYNKILYLLDILSKDSYFYDYDRWWIESMIMMIWKIWKIDENETVEYLYDILKEEIKWIYKPTKENIEKINSWEWCIIWVMNPTSKYSIWRWINLQNYKNFFLLYVDSYDAEELNQALWRTDRITKNAWKRNHLLYKLDNYNIEIWNFIERIKKWWNFYAWESKAKEVSKFIDEWAKIKLNNLEANEINLKISWNEIYESVIYISEKADWFIKLFEKLEIIVSNEQTYWKEILWWLFSNTNIIKSIL